jgi:hypothetical protein
VVIRFFIILIIICNRGLPSKDLMSKSDPMVMLSAKNLKTGKFEYVGRTERLGCVPLFVFDMRHLC